MKGSKEARWKAVKSEVGREGGREEWRKEGRMTERK